MTLDDRVPSADGATAAPYESFYIPVRQAPRKFQHRWGRHILLLVITVVTTTVFGVDHYLSFSSNFGTRVVAMNRHVWLEGFLYSLSILGILGAHEMGHYIACRRYDVDATLPFFLPFPSLSGTLGAVIKIREAFPTRTALFDIGVAGPIAGFVVLIPFLFVGMALSNVIRVPAHMEGWSLGEPLLFKFASWIVFGRVADGYSVNMLNGPGDPLTETPAESLATLRATGMHALAMPPYLIRKKAEPPLPGQAGTVSPRLTRG